MISEMGVITVLMNSMVGAEMTIFGLSDPFIIGAYLSCFLCVILCCAWAVFKKSEDEDEGDD
jgi:hypothetical protein